VIDVRRVDKRFRSTTRGVTAAVHDMSIQVARGELLCLVGPSGCGKTTLLNLMAGLERPDAGEILVEGHLVRGPGPDRVVMFQDAALFPWLDVSENVGFGLRELRLPRAQRDARVRKYLDSVKMSGFAHAYIHELSGGMKQRVALARALALEPDILLMDEPFGALDPKSRDALQAELVDVWRTTGTTIVFVTHDMAEAVTLGSRVIVLRARPARVARSVDIEPLLPRPRHVDQPAVVALAQRLKHELEETKEHQAHESDDDDDGRDEALGPADDRPGDVARAMGLPL
jgi:NitT/TauT family transport system ATP-binding protein